MVGYNKSKTYAGADAAADFDNDDDDVDGIDNNNVNNDDGGPCAADYDDDGCVDGSPGADGDVFQQLRTACKPLIYYY